MIRQLPLLPLMALLAVGCIAWIINTEPGNEHLLGRVVTVAFCRRTRCARCARSAGLWSWPMSSLTPSRTRATRCCCGTTPTCSAVEALPRHAEADVGSRRQSGTARELGGC